MKKLKKINSNADRIKNAELNMKMHVNCDNSPIDLKLVWAKAHCELHHGTLV